MINIDRWGSKKDRELLEESIQEIKSASITIPIDVSEGASPEIVSEYMGKEITQRYIDMIMNIAKTNVRLLDAELTKIFNFITAMNAEENFAKYKGAKVVLKVSKGEGSDIVVHLLVDSPAPNRYNYGFSNIPLNIRLRIISELQKKGIFPQKNPSDGKVLDLSFTTLESHNLGLAETSLGMGKFANALDRRVKQIFGGVVNSFVRSDSAYSPPDRFARGKSIFHIFEVKPHYRTMRPFNISDVNHNIQEDVSKLGNWRKEQN